MYPAQSVTSVDSAFAPCVVGAITLIVVIGIVAWVVHTIAIKALDKSSPETAPAVLLALAQLVRPLAGFFPWSHRPSPFGLSVPSAHIRPETFDSESAGELPAGSRDEQ